MDSKHPRPRGERFTALRLSGYSEVEESIRGALSRRLPRTELIDVREVLGRTCAGTVRSKSNVPPTAVSAMDGYCVRAADTVGASASAPVSLTVLDAPSRADGLASTWDIRLESGEAAYVSTGSSLPRYGDCVVRVEEARVENGKILLRRRVEPGKNVDATGADVAYGEVLFGAGHVFGFADAALLVSAGFATVRVLAKPTVGIISVGDELVTFEEWVASAPQAEVPHQGAA